MKFTNLLIAAMRLEMFLMISRNFFWHNGIMFKLEQNSASGNLRDILQNFLDNRKQRVMLNEQEFVRFNSRSIVPSQLY